MSATGGELPSCLATPVERVVCVVFVSKLSLFSSTSPPGTLLMRARAAFEWRMWDGTRSSYCRSGCATLSSQPTFLKV